jgi:anti-anti-sigma factor
MQFRIQKSDDELLRVDTAGEFVRGSASIDDDPLADLLGDGVYGQRVLLNLKQCRHLDSTGIGYLLTCHRRFDRQGGKLVLHSISPAVSRLLQLMRVDQLLHIAGNASEAAELMKNGCRQDQPHE